jgi:hypothetical protein
MWIIKTVLNSKWFWCICWWLGVDNNIQFTYILALETYLYARRWIMRRTKTCSIIDTSNKELCSTAIHLVILKRKCVLWGGIYGNYFSTIYFQDNLRRQTGDFCSVEYKIISLSVIHESYRTPLRNFSITKRSVQRFAAVYRCWRSVVIERQIFFFFE